jgi:hypothetical protein
MRRTRSPDLDPAAALALHTVADELNARGDRHPGSSSPNPPSPITGSEQKCFLLVRVRDGFGDPVLLGVSRTGNNLRQSLFEFDPVPHLVLTKTDLAPDAGTLLAQIRRLNPDAPLWRAAEQAIDAAALLDGAAHSPLRAVPAATDGPHGSVHGFALSFEGELDWTMFGVWLTMLLNRHGEAVLRVKGILNVAGSPTPVAIHGVQHLVHPPVHMTAWPDGDRSSRLVFIVDGIDRGLIERSLRAFLQLAAPSLAAA